MGTRDRDRTMTATLHKPGDAMLHRPIRMVLFALFAVLFVSLCRPSSASAAPATQPAASAGKGTIAVFTLKNELRESPAEEGLPIFEQPGTTLRQLTSRMKKAAEDANVKAVVITNEGGSMGLGQIEEI